MTRHGVDAGGGYLEWLRTVDFTPADTPDAGRLRYAGDDIDTLIESGLAGEYVEYWHRDPVTSGSCCGRLLSGGTASGDGTPLGELSAVLVRVGAVFGFARGRANALPMGARLPELIHGASAAASGAPAELVDCEISLGLIDAERWTITRSSLPFREGSELGVEFEATPTGEAVWTADIDASGMPLRRCWSVEFEERLGAGP